MTSSLRFMHDSAIRRLVYSILTSFPSLYAGELMVFISPTQSQLKGHKRLQDLDCSFWPDVTESCATPQCCGDRMVPPKTLFLPGKVSLPLPPLTDAPYSCPMSYPLWRAGQRCLKESCAGGELKETVAPQTNGSSSVEELSRGSLGCSSRFQTLLPTQHSPSCKATHLHPCNCL